MIRAISDAASVIGIQRRRVDIAKRAGPRTASIKFIITPVTFNELRGREPTNKRYKFHFHPPPGSRGTRRVNKIWTRKLAKHALKRNEFTSIRRSFISQDRSDTGGGAKNGKMAMSAGKKLERNKKKRGERRKKRKDRAKLIAMQIFEPFRGRVEASTRLCVEPAAQGETFLSRISSDYGDVVFCRSSSSPCSSSLSSSSSQVVGTCVHPQWETCARWIMPRIRGRRK